MKDEKKELRLEGITKVYYDYKTKKPFNAVDNLTLNIEAASFVTLLGPSGCGKTTTLRMIGGFESPDEGEIYLGSEPITMLSPNKRDTAMVFQNYALLPHYNVFDNVAYGLKVRKVPSEEIKKRVLEMLDLVELTGLEERHIYELSGGQQQRVALARALVVRPNVLLFDEPLSNLDAKLRVSMRTEIRRIQQTVGITAVYVTHDQSEAMSISDKIVIMKKGVIAQEGSPREIYRMPKNRFVADFIGEANFLSAHVISYSNGKALVAVSGGNKITAACAATLREGQECTLVVRPEVLSLSESGLLKCKVIVSTFMGAYHYYQVVCEGKVVKITDYNAKREKIYKVGEEAFLHFESENVHIIAD